jgi:hypothetical protein
MRFIAFLVLGFPLLVNANEQETQRALIERDQRTAEFAAGVRGIDRRSLEILHERQLFDVRPLTPYHADRMRREREAFVLRLPPPQANSGSDPDLKPLPLPGGPKHLVQPIPSQGVGG